MPESKKPKFEPGIYNYCDRWCEKCQKTAKCLLFAKEKENELEIISQGIDPKSPEGAMKMIAISFEETMSLIREHCEKEGIDLTTTKEEDLEFEQFKKMTDPKNLSLYKAARALHKEISDWLQSVPSLDIKAYRQAYESVVWHHSLIFVKTARTLSSFLEYHHEDEDVRDYSLDDAIKSGWVCVRSTTICRDSFELMDGYIRDSRIAGIIAKCNKHLSSLQKHIDKMAAR